MRVKRRLHQQKQLLMTFRDGVDSLLLASIFVQSRAFFHVGGHVRLKSYTTVQAFGSRSSTVLSHVRDIVMSEGEESEQRKGDSPKVEDAYRLAMEEDETWFNMVICDILGDDENKDIVEKVSERGNFLDERETNRSSRQQRDVLQSQKIAENETQSLAPTFDKVYAGGDGTFSSEKALASEHVSTFLDDIDEGGNITNGGNKYQNTSVATTGLNDESTNFGINNRRIRLPAEPGKRGNEDFTLFDEKDMSSAAVKYVDIYGREQCIPVSQLTELGYQVTEIQNITALAMERIIQADIRRPKDGLPKHWKLRPADDTEVELIRSSKVYDKTKRPRGIPEMERNDRKRRSAGMKRGMYRTRGQSLSRRRAFRSGVNYSHGDKGLWMDLATFRTFLRKEAQFRLSILGPGWLSAVKGESRWRLEMYRRWLRLMKDDKKVIHKGSKVRESHQGHHRGSIERRRRRME